MSNLIILQSVNSMLNLLEARRILQVNRRRRLKRLRFLIKLKVQERAKRAAPRAWRFEKESTLINNAFTWPDNVFARKFRMSKLLFELCTVLAPDLEKQDLLRPSIPLKTRVAVAIYTLKSGAD